MAKEPRQTEGPFSWTWDKQSSLGCKHPDKRWEKKERGCGESHGTFVIREFWKQHASLSPAFHGQNSIAWPHVTSRESGKHGLACLPRESRNEVWWPHSNLCYSPQFWLPSTHFILSPIHRGRKSHIVCAWSSNSRISGRYQSSLSASRWDSLCSADLWIRDANYQLLTLFLYIQ